MPFAAKATVTGLSIDTIQGMETAGRIIYVNHRTPIARSTVKQRYRIFASGMIGLYIEPRNY